MMITMEIFNYFLIAMSFLALLVFVALYFVKAGYGIFRTSSWGISIPNKTAWFLMEAPVFFVLFYLWITSENPFSIPILIFFLLFELHYFQRSFIFPFLMKGKSRMPLTIVGMGVVFNVLNGIMQALGLFYLPVTDTVYSGGWHSFVSSHAILGMLLFFLGMGINLHSDYVIRHLRQPGDTRHYLPTRGMFKYVTSANYLGELIEWIGFALLTISPAAGVFVWWTFANLVPRAHAIHQHYRKEFGTLAVGTRKRIIPFIY